MATLVSAFSKHLDGGGAKRGLNADAQRQMEEQLQAETERRLALTQELEAAKAELASVDARFKVSHTQLHTFGIVVLHTM